MTHDGETRTIKEWSDINGINTATLYYRLRQGLTGADVLAPVLANNARRYHAAKHTIDGESLTLAEWAKRAGMKLNTLQARLSRGKTLTEALIKPVGRPKTGRR